ncbi:MAG TPA: cytidylate kinase-like family protein [Chloroflexota bacterium]|nr:cytidylate kinase-like family protein [Chloroflexota bacterium]
MPVVTIARQMGAGGEEIARLVALRLGARLLDAELLELASEQTGIPLRYFELLDERGRSMWRNPADLFRLVPLPPINPDLPDVYGDRYPPTGPVRARGDGLQSPAYWAAEAYAAALSRTIQRVAQAGESAVVVGRGGNEALAVMPEALNVLVVASEPQRLRRLAYERGVNVYEALDAVRDSDRRRRAFIRQFYGADWLDASRFDLVVRTDNVPLDAAAEIVVTAANATAASTKVPNTPLTEAVPAHAA